MYHRNPRLGAFTFGSQGGNLLQDPVIPTLTGYSFLKVVAVAAVTLWLVRKAFK